MEIEGSGEEIELRVAGLFVLRSEFVAEGYYENDAEGDPPEQDLFRIEVTTSVPEAGFRTLSYPLLMPAAGDEWQPPDLHSISCCGRSASQPFPPAVMPAPRPIPAGSPTRSSD